jgi:hypothetical protein
VVATEPSREGRRGLVPWDTWQRQSRPKQGGRIRSRGTCDSVRALSSREAGSGAARHVAAPEPSQARRQDPEPRDTWQCRSHPEQGGKIRRCRAYCSTSSLSWTQACMRRYLVSRYQQFQYDNQGGERLQRNVVDMQFFERK